MNEQAMQRMRAFMVGDSERRNVIGRVQAADGEQCAAQRGRQQEHEQEHGAAEQIHEQISPWPRALATHTHTQIHPPNKLTLCYMLFAFLFRNPQKKTKRGEKKRQAGAGGAS